MSEEVRAARDRARRLPQLPSLDDALGPDWRNLRPLPSPLLARPSRLPPETFQAGRWTLDPKALTLTFGVRVKNLSPPEARILRLLLGNAGKTFSHDELHAAGWPGGRRGGPGVRDGHIAQVIYRLRDLLEYLEGRHLKTVRRKGYCWDPPQARTDALPE